MMTKDHEINRKERIAIMMESGESYLEAERYCNTRPDLYGTVDIYFGSNGHTEK